jgi:hypothetical protein
MGDIPIFVAHDSADVWAHPDLFRLKKDGTPEVVAGVPPDYFSATGPALGQSPGERGGAVDHWLRYKAPANDKLELLARRISDLPS